MPRPRILVGVGAVGLFGLVASGQTDEAGELEAYTGYGGEDPGFVLPNQPIEGAMGFSKSVLETPRSVSVISAEMISSMSISEVSDLSRIASMGSSGQYRYSEHDGGHVFPRNETD